MFAGAASARRRPGLGHEAVDEVRRVLGASGAWACTGRGGWPVAWGSVSDRWPDSPAPRSTRTKRCSLTGSTRSSTPGTADASQAIHERGAPLRGDPAGPPVGDPAGRVEGAEVPARRDVARPEVEVDAQGLQDAAPDRVAERLVAEQAEVPRAAPRGDAGADVAEQAAGAPPRQRVQVGHPGRLQLGPPGGRVRKATQAVCREEDDLGGAGNGQAANQIQIHRRASCGCRV